MGSIRPWENPKIAEYSDLSTESVVAVDRFECFSWWTRSQRIRTEGEIEFETALVDLSHMPAYIMIAEKALHLQKLKMNTNRIAVALDVDRTTVVRALRWIKSKPKYHTRGFKDP